MRSDMKIYIPISSIRILPSHSYWIRINKKIIKSNLMSRNKPRVTLSLLNLKKLSPTPTVTPKLTLPNTSKKTYLKIRCLARILVKIAWKKQFNNFTICWIQSSKKLRHVKNSNKYYWSLKLFNFWTWLT